MAKMQALICRECGKEYSTEAVHVCELCFGPLEVKYNYDEIREKDVAHVRGNRSQVTVAVQRITSD